MRRNVKHLKKRPEQFDADTNDDIHIQPRHINTGHRQPHKDENVQPAQQPRRTGGTRRPTKRFGTEIPSKFLSGFK